MGVNWSVADGACVVRFPPLREEYVPAFESLEAALCRQAKRLVGVWQKTRQADRRVTSGAQVLKNYSIWMRRELEDEQAGRQAHRQVVAYNL